MSVSGKTISYKTIVENVFRNFKFNYEIDHHDVLEWIGSLFALLDVPITLEDKIKVIEIIDYRGKLPCDLHSIIQCARQYDVADSNDVELVPMRWASSTFHKKYHCTRTDYECGGSFTYKVNNNYMFTSFENGDVAIAYKAIPTDADGFPTIPSEESWRKAMEFEVAYRIAYILFLRGEITGDRFQLIERDRDWYIAQAANKAKIFDIARFESFQADWIRSIPKINSYDSFFANMQLPEQRFNLTSLK